MRIAQHLELDELVAVEELAREMERAHGVLGRVAAGGIGKVGELGRRQHVEERWRARILPDVRPADRHGDDLGTRSDNRRAGLGEVLVLAGADEKTRTVGAPGDLERIDDGGRRRMRGVHAVDFTPFRSTAMRLPRSASPCSSSAGCLTISTIRAASHLSMPTDLRFGVDRLAVRGKRVFVWGWVTDRERSISDVHLRLRGRGWQKRLAAIVGLAREDVAAALPSHAGARFSGFVVTGYVPDASVEARSLEVTFDDGHCAVFDIGGEADANTPLRLWRAAWRRLKARDLGSLLRRRGSDGAGIASADDPAGRATLLRSLGTARPVRIIFDHDMGGGANHYRRETIARWLAASESAILCTYHLPTLDYRLHVFVPGEQEREFRAGSFLALEAILQRAPVAEMFVNSPVTFDAPIVFADWVARMRRRHAATRVTVAAHDYFAACPSFVLLNADGRYCGIPDVRECERCLPRHEATYVAFSPPTRIGPWREAWGRCLEAADEVRCFSESTRVLLLRAHPALARERTTVIPHCVDFSPRRPQVRHAGPLVIGVMGYINAQKGAHVVAGIAERIETAHPNVRLVVLGTLEIPSRASRLTVTGPYRREDLPDLIEAHGINMFLFPSIWPETYSYVVAEMTALELPVVAFDLGAPAERLRGYRLARLCGEVGVEPALATMLAFHRELAMGETEVA